MKTTMKMDVLRCETVAGVLKELAVFCLAYNLVRSAMGESARLRGLAPDRVSLVDAVRWLIGVEDVDASVLVVNPSRRGRVEPRAVKRRPKKYRRMNEPSAMLQANADEVILTYPIAFAYALQELPLTAGPRTGYSIGAALVRIAMLARP